jgi:hypothetical protein
LIEINIPPEVLPCRTSPEGERQPHKDLSPSNGYSLMGEAFAYGMRGGFLVAWTPETAPTVFRRKERNRRMRLHLGSASLLFLMIALVIPAAAPPRTGPSVPAAEGPDGRYLVMISGCNDCHTRGFTQALGRVLSSDWLTGDTTGWWGPWGTTYPGNLRLLIPPLSEEAWIQFARELKTKPPMPWWVLHEMRESDLRAMYRFIKGLGPKGEAAPADLPPGQKPPVPYVQFVFGNAGRRS